VSTATVHAPSRELAARVAAVHREGIRLQLERDVLTAARAAQEPGHPLAPYVRVQCEWRGIDPTPYLDEIGEAA